MSETAAKKDVQKLQRVIVDALEDVKAQDIQVFNTEHLSPLFERVIIASGTSNRQTKALSSSVRDKVRESGFGKPRIEGEDNGEWIIADCGQAVVHIMQPVIRQYYNLEEIWGDKPVRLKFGAPKPEAKPAQSPKTSKSAKAVKKPADQASKALTPQQAAAAARKVAGQTASEKPAAKATAKTSAKAAAPKPALKAPAKKMAAQKASSTGVSKVVVGKPVAKPAAKKSVAQKLAAKKSAAPVRKPVKPAARKAS